jgi:lipoyl(octanoyl) transferase
MPELFHLSEPLSYEKGLELQQDTVARILAHKQPESILLLEHEPVYTIGRQRDQSSLLQAGSSGIPVYETNRGGQATYHGPGQLVGYPILDLTRRGKDLHEHLRLIEQALIQGCAEFGVNASRREGMTGVWVEDRKLASIGVGVRKWVSMHGFAINITKQCLPPFLAITPCGLDGVSMTCLANEASEDLSVNDAVEVFGEALEKVLG